MLRKLEKEAQTPAREDVLEKINRRCMRIIEKNTRKAKVHHFITSTMVRAGRAAAIIIAFIVLVGGIAFASSKNVREYLCNLLLERSREFTRIVLEPIAFQPAEIPPEWEEDYFLTEIPQRVKRSQAFSGEVYYTDGISSVFQLLFLVNDNDENCEVFLDTEDARTERISIHSIPAEMVLKNEFITVIWSVGDRFFLLGGRDMDEATMIRIAEGVKKIN